MIVKCAICREDVECPDGSPNLSEHFYHEQIPMSQGKGCRLPMLMKVRCMASGSELLYKEDEGVPEGFTMKMLLF